MLGSGSALLLGFVLGMRHAIDPDHILAVLTIVSRERRLGGAALIGGLWGVGHTLTIVVVGGTIVLFGLAVPPRVGLALELSVAVMLVVLGVGRLAAIAHDAEFVGVHAHPHRHGDRVHSHPHAHGAAHTHHELRALEALRGRLAAVPVLRPLLVGAVHGLAGSAAVALLVLAAIPRPALAMAYLLVFGAGTVAGMLLVTVANAVPFAWTAARFTRMNRWLGVASGLLSVGFGGLLAYQIGFVDGLFTNQPQWTP